MHHVRAKGRGPRDQPLGRQVSQTVPRGPPVGRTFEIRDRTTRRRISPPPRITDRPAAAMLWRGPVPSWSSELRRNEEVTRMVARPAGPGQHIRWCAGARCLRPARVRMMRNEPATSRTPPPGNQRNLPPPKRPWSPSEDRLAREQAPVQRINSARTIAAPQSQTEDQTRGLPSSRVRGEDGPRHRWRWRGSWLSSNLLDALPAPAGPSAASESCS